MAKSKWGSACATAALAALELAQVVGESVPRVALGMLAGATMILALASAARSVAFYWRGPTVVAFDRRDGVLCDVAEAAAVRACAQLRGTLGGAGHVHRRRLLPEALAWISVAAHAAEVLFTGRSPPSLGPLAAAAALALLALLFPARAFWYREASGGCVIVHPTSACLRLLETAGVAPAFTRMDPEGPRPRVAARWGPGPPGVPCEREDAPNRPGLDG